MPCCIDAAFTNCDAIKTATFSTGSTQMRSAFGACNVYRKSINKLLKVSRPQYDYLQKYNDFDWWDPTFEALSSFNTLSSKLAEPPALALPQPHRQIMIHTSSYVYALTAVLLQQQSDRNLNQLATVGYCRQTLNLVENVYSETEEKCLSVERAYQSLRPYIKRISVKVPAEHSAQSWMHTCNDSNKGE